MEVSERISTLLCRGWKWSRLGICTLFIGICVGCEVHQGDQRPFAKSPPGSRVHFYDEEDFKRVGLPLSAAQRIIGSKRYWAAIVDVQKVKEQRRAEGDLLGVSLSIAKTVGFEGIYHTQLVLRKNSADTDWSKARIYSFIGWDIRFPDGLLALPWKEIWKYLERD